MHRMVFVKDKKCQAVSFNHQVPSNDDDDTNVWLFFIRIIIISFKKSTGQMASPTTISGSPPVLSHFHIANGVSRDDIVFTFCVCFNSLLVGWSKLLSTKKTAPPPH